MSGGSNASPDTADFSSHVYITYWCTNTNKRVVHIGNAFWSNTENPLCWEPKAKIGTALVKRESLILSVVGFTWRRLSHLNIEFFLNRFNFPALRDLAKLGALKAVGEEVKQLWG